MPSYTLEPGYYDERMTISATLTQVGDATYEYIHHVHAQTDNAETEVTNDLAPSSSVEKAPEYLSKKQGCYTKLVTVSHSHPLWRTNEDLNLVGTYATCPWCGRSCLRTHEGREHPNEKDHYASASCNGGGVEYRYYPACGLDNGEVTDIHIHYDNE